MRLAGNSFISIYPEGKIIFFNTTQGELSVKKNITFAVDGTSNLNADGSRRQNIIKNARRRLESGNPVEIHIDENSYVEIGNYMGMSGDYNLLGIAGELPSHVKPLVKGTKYFCSARFVRFYEYSEGGKKGLVGLEIQL